MEIPTPTDLQSKELPEDAKAAFVKLQTDVLQNKIIEGMVLGSRSDRIFATTISDTYCDFKKRYGLAGWIACENDIEEALVARFKKAGWRLKIEWNNRQKASELMVVFYYWLTELK